MQKISKTRTPAPKGYAIDLPLNDARPQRIAGGTITSKPVSIDLDLRMLLANPRDGATISGASQTLASPGPETSDAGTTVALSDGTRITFITAGQLTVMETV